MESERQIEISKRLSEIGAIVQDYIDKGRKKEVPQRLCDEWFDLINEYKLLLREVK